MTSPLDDPAARHQPAATPLTPVRILVAEDEAVSRRVLQAKLSSWGYDVQVCGDGRSALQILQSESRPPLAVLDWLMPEKTGLEICQTLRQQSAASPPVYLILLTSNARREDVVAGLEAGADDYIVKPFHPDDLRARVQVGVRMVGLQRALTDRVQELEQAMSRVQQLQGLLPICAYCKKIRDDRNYWSQVESYIARHSNVRFTHGICPECYDRIVKAELDELASQPVVKAQRRTALRQAQGVPSVSRDEGPEVKPRSAGAKRDAST